MKNSQIKSVLFVAFMLLAFGCSKENDTNLKVNGSEENPTITTHLFGGKYTLTVDSSSDWTAVVPEESEWISILETKDKGAITFIVEELSLNDASRKGEIILTSGNKQMICNVHQDTDLDNGIPTNSSNYASYILSQDYGLGHGVDITTGSILSPILSMNSLQNHQCYSDILKLNVWPVTDFRKSDYDSLSVKKDSLGVAVEVGVKFGTFDLKIKGEYHGGTSKNTNHIGYPIEYAIDAAAADIDLSEVFARMYDSDYTSEEQATYKKLRNSKFKKIYEKVLSSHGSTEFEKAVETLVNTYGAVYVSHTDLGGSLYYTMDIDSLVMRDELGIKGELVAALKVATFKIDVNAQASFTTDGYNIFARSTREGLITGGTAETQGALSSFLMMKDPGDKDNFVNGLNPLIKNWASTVKFSNDPSVCNVSLTTYKCSGIWTLFENEEIQNAVRDCCLVLYKGKNTIVNLDKLTTKVKVK